MVSAAPIAPIPVTEARRRAEAALQRRCIPRTLEAVVEERDELAARVRQLEEVLTDESWVPGKWHLTPVQLVMINLIARRQVTSREALWTALYGGDSDGGPTSPRIDLHIMKLRRRLAPHGIAIVTHYGRGFSLDAASRVAIAELQAERGRT